MRKLRIDFCNFWGGFDIYNNIITTALTPYYELIHDDIEPDVVFQHGNPGHKLGHPDALTFSWLVESMTRIGQPNFNGCDYALGSCSHEDSRYHRIPFWSTQINWSGNGEVYQPHSGPTLLLDPNKLTTRNPSIRDRTFCSVASNPVQFRDDYYKWFGLTHPIDHGGRHMRNVPDLQNDSTGGDANYRAKLDFLAKYNFNFCFENDKYPGYVCEKILHAFYANTIPVYWGPVNIVKIDNFNPKAFIDIHNFPTRIAGYKYLVDIAQDNDRTINMMSEPVFIDNQIPHHATPEALGNFLSERIG